ncbi:MAG: pseudouridine synthase [Candidatus Binataceae bacterium]
MQQVQGASGRFREGRRARSDRLRLIAITGQGLKKKDRVEKKDRVGKERIAKFLSRAGVASRRESERLIEAGRVVLNGVVVAHPATLVSKDDALAVDGKAVAGLEQSKIWRYHKPAGLVTTARDPQGRLTVFAALSKTLPRLISVGRLDINTEGLLLLTNDGELARYLEHPAQGISRTYRIRAHGNVDETAIARLAKGVTIDGIRYRPVETSLDSRQGSNCWLTMTLREGKNREIKKLLEQVGLQVTRLIRTGYGPFQLGRLAQGAVEEVPRRMLPNLLPYYFAR